MKLYLFDFDGTISKSDSMFEFLKMIHTFPSFYFLLIKSFPILIQYKFNLINKNEFKSNFLMLFLSNFSKSYLENKARKFAEIYYSKLKKDAINYINELKKDKNNEITIVSASLDIWIKPISEKLGVKYISTFSKYKNNFFSGIKGENCWGNEKVLRINKIYKKEDYDEIFAFGDSMGDKQMLDFATYKRFRFFNQ